jgi:tripartite-type tricarboxylate transporter receptor subunit TctC
LEPVVRVLLSFVFFVALSTSAFAQSYPSRSIRMVVPFPPAGIADLSGRLVAEGLRAKFNQQVIVENKPAPTASSGSARCSRASPTATP